MGLGPADERLLTAAARQALDAAGRCFLRTRRHPAAAAVPGAESFDHLYEAGRDLGSVYAAVVATLVEAAREAQAGRGAPGPVTYAVPGSPTVAERTVALLGHEELDLELVAGLSFADLAWARLGLDPVAAGVRLVDGHRFAAEAAGSRGPLLVAQCDSPAVLSDIKLAMEGAEDLDRPDEVVVLQRLGSADEQVLTVPWPELDREVRPDHLTTLYLPRLSAPVGGELVGFAELVRTLRARCPWDREQTHATLTRHLVEEAYEVLEAIEHLDGGPAEPGTEVAAHLAEELGDLLFQVVFHARLAAEAGAFTLADVARGIHDKLVRRHPHVFGDVEAGSAGAVVAHWEQIKRRERASVSLMASVPSALPATLVAHKVQRKASSVGLEPVTTESLARLAGAPAPTDAEGVGEVLFAAVALARRAGHDPESALRGASRRFRRRFEALEAALAADGRDVTEVEPGELAERWASLGPGSAGHAPRG